MTDYRRNFVAGGSFFFTVNLAERRLSLLTQHIDELRGAFRVTRRHHPFTIDAIAVLPDHLHAVWTLPEDDADFATRWRLIKSAFSPPRRNWRTDFRRPRRQRRTRHLAAALLGAYDSRRERFRAAYRLHPNQPGQARAGAAGQGLAVFIVHRMVKLGIYPEDWAGDASDGGGDFGERP